MQTGGKPVLEQDKSNTVLSAAAARIKLVLVKNRNLLLVENYLV